MDFLNNPGRQRTLNIWGIMAGLVYYMYMQYWFVCIINAMSIVRVLFFISVYWVLHHLHSHILVKELTAATRVMQSSSNELSTLVSGKAKCKQMKVTT